MKANYWLMLLVSGYCSVSPRAEHFFAAIDCPEEYRYKAVNACYVIDYTLGCVETQVGLVCECCRNFVSP